MPITLTAAMDAARQKAEKFPALAVVFDGIPFTFGSAAIIQELCLVAGLTNPDTGVTFVANDNNPTTGDPIVAADCFNSETSQVKTLGRPSGFGSSVTPHQGQSSHSLVQIPILFTDELSTVITDFVIRNRKVTVTAGFSDVPSSEWVPVFGGLVDNYRQSDQGLSYEFSTVDVQRSQTNQVFNVLDVPLTNAAGVPATGAFVLEMDDAAGYDDFVPGLVRIDSEIMRYDDVDTTVAPNTLNIIDRALFGTEEKAHSEGAKVREILRLEGRPIEIALAVLTGSGGSGPQQVTLPLRHHLGMLPSVIDTATYQLIAQTFSQDFVFFIDGPEDGKTWLEREIFKVNNCYQPTLGDGRVSLKLFAPPVADQELFEFNESNVDRETIPAIDANLPQVYNRAIWKFDWDPGTQKFRTILPQNDLDSQGVFDRVYPITIESKGMRTQIVDSGQPEPTFAGTTIAQANSGRLFTRYGLAPVTVSFSGLYETFHVEPGELVVFNHTKPLNPRTGGRGWSGQILEIVSKSMNFNTGQMEFRALYTPFAGFRYGRYGEDASDYSVLAAIPSAKDYLDTYSFIAFDPVAPDLEGKMGNGDPPYRFG